MKKTMKAVAALMLMTAVVFAAGCTKEDNADGDGITNGHTYVDLGLPSGTLWAACNVGANTPEGYGDFFAWGETYPKDCYNWSTYKYCNGSWRNLTKYSTKSSHGVVDNLVVLQPIDDAATANWGDEWRMPTLAEWMVLFHNTSCEWVIQNGVNGGLFTAMNGNSIFLPAARGKYDYKSPKEDYDYCNYYSSSLDTDGPSGAWCIMGDQSGFYVQDKHNERCNGLSVRPVRSAK
jgi:hypothetical protein